MVEPRKRAGFIQEPGQPPVVVLRVRIGMGYHCARLRARRKLHRQVFLDSHELVQVGVIGPVGDAEAPGAQDRIEAVLLKAGAGWEGVNVVDGHGWLPVPGCSGWMVPDCRAGFESVST